MADFVRLQDVKKLSPHVKLDDIMIEEAKTIADDRMSTMGSDKNGHKTYRGEMPGESVTTEEAYLLGAMGEIAAREAFGVEVDKEITPTGDGGEDFIIDGRVVDLKTTDHHDPALLVSDQKIQKGRYENTDAFILAYRELDCHIYFLGYASFAEIMEQEPERFPDKYLNRYIYWRDLHRFNHYRAI